MAKKKGGDLGSRVKAPAVAQGHGDLPRSPQPDGSRHTPGPWGIERTPDTNWIGPLRHSGDGKVDDVVCSTDREGLKPDVLQRNDANAHLIAVAPDLLVVAKAIINYCPFCSPPSPTVTPRKCRAPFHGHLRAAIAKAEGR